MNPVVDPAEDVLLQHPWLPVTIAGRQLLAKSWFGETAYRVLLTDLQCVWEERMDAAAIERRAQELNRRLRASAAAFFSHLREVAQPCFEGGGQVQISVSRQEDGNLALRLKSDLAGLPVYWEFHCSPAPVALVCGHLVRPLLAMSRLLQRQVEHLGDLLVRKDEEIQDYQENGATLSRERLQTDVFDRQPHTEAFIHQTLPLLWSEPSDGHGFNADLQQLYAAVAARRSAPKRRRPDETAAGENRPSPEPPAQTEPLPSGRGSAKLRDVGSVRGDSTRDEKLQRPDGRKASGPAPPTTPPRPAERPAPKPKKKKVGLFS